MAKRKLIEAALPLDAINAACKADKDRKTGTIRNLHKWFAPMPTPAWRALLFASLVDDPEDDEGREELWALIEELVESGPAPPADGVLARADAAIAKSNPRGTPLVLDPFCGGGSTVVEAMRLGLQGHGSDLNPVPVLITRTLTQLLPAVRGRGPYRQPSGQQELIDGPFAGFLHDVMQHAANVRSHVLSEVSALYPPSPSGKTVFAWLWARTATCANPACKAETLLATNWWLCKRKGEAAWLEPSPTDPPGEIKLRICHGAGAPPPVPKVGRGASFRCLTCDAVLEEEYLAREGAARRIRNRLLALACIDKGKRSFELPDSRQHEVVAGLERDSGLEMLAVNDGGGRQRFGFDTWADLFTPRQSRVLDAFASAVSQVRDAVLADGADEPYADAVASVLGLAVGRLAHANSTQSRWNTARSSPKIEPAFGRHDLPMTWDFAEANPFAGSVGDWDQAVTTVLRGVALSPASGQGSASLADARQSVRNHANGSILVATDPPYFGHIDYSELSDYFYVWLRRALRHVHPDLFGLLLPPRDAELVALAGRHDGSTRAAYEYFVDGFTEVFDHLAAAQAGEYPMLIVYAHREEDQGARATGGWEAMLEALLAAGLSIVGTLPLHATRGQRLIGLGANALATYVVMVCRPRPDDAPRTTRHELEREMRDRLATAVHDLQKASVAPVDLAQAVIGPGMAAYSRYAAVLQTDGTRMPVGAALKLINRTLAEVLDEQEGDLDPDSRWAVTWYEQHGFAPAAFGEADQLARAKGIAVNSLVQAGIVTSGASRVSLLRRQDLLDGWNPATDRRATAWEAVHHLARALESGGETAAARLYVELGPLRDPARELAYRLYLIAERKGRTEEAVTYNGLVTSWPEVARLSDGLPEAATSTPAPEALF